MTIIRFFDLVNTRLAYKMRIIRICFMIRFNQFTKMLSSRLIDKFLALIVSRFQNNNDSDCSPETNIRLNINKTPENLSSKYYRRGWLYISVISHLNSTHQDICPFNMCPGKNYHRSINARYYQYF